MPHATCDRTTHKEDDMKITRNTRETTPGPYKEGTL